MQKLKENHADNDEGNADLRLVKAGRGIEGHQAATEVSRIRGLTAGRNVTARSVRGAATGVG